MTLKEKNFRIAGVITEYVKAKIGVRLIIVGGLSVEIYTEGGYMTRDIDFVGEDHSSIMKCLEELGFEPTWKYKKNILGGEVMRFHNKLNTLVEVPSETLKGADYSRVQRLKTEDGLEVWVISKEDIIADRIRAVYHHKDAYHLPYIVEIIRRNAEILDYEYINRVLTQEEAAILKNALLVLSEIDDGETMLKKIKLEMSKLTYQESDFYRISSFFENLILFKIGSNDYIGFTTYPALNLYIYDDEEDAMDYLDPDREALSLDEVVEWLSNIENTGGYDLSDFISIVQNVVGESNSK